MRRNGRCRRPSRTASRRPCAAPCQCPGRADMGGLRPCCTARKAHWHTADTEHVTHSVGQEQRVRIPHKCFCRSAKPHLLRLGGFSSQCILFCARLQGPQGVSRKKSLVQLKPAACLTFFFTTLGEEIKKNRLQFGNCCKKKLAGWLHCIPMALIVYVVFSTLCFHLFLATFDKLGGCAFHPRGGGGSGIPGPLPPPEVRRNNGCAATTRRLTAPQPAASLLDTLQDCHRTLGDRPRPSCRPPPTFMSLAARCPLQNFAGAQPKRVWLGSLHAGAAIPYPHAVTWTLHR